MTFLNPILLLGLPLMALPIIIHLINQRRHRTIKWGAMMFLLSAKRMSRGMARLRHILIMASRIIAIAALIFAIGRPLATGWFGSLTGGKPETVIVLLDRSASMQQQELATSESKLSAGLSKIVDMVKAFDGSKRLVLIDSATNKPIEIESAKSMLEMTQTSSSDASADIPSMIQTALEFVTDNQTGRTDIWICSDARQNDWDAESSRWPTLNSEFSELDGIRFHVLNYPEKQTQNLSVVVERTERVESEQKSELVLDVKVRRTGDIEDTQEVPLEFSIDGVRSVVKIQMEYDEYLLAGHRIQLDQETKVGWGKIELPADTNPSDNVYYFPFAEQPVYQTVIVTDDDRAIESLKLVCSTAATPNQKLKAEVIRPDQLTEIDWGLTALLIWKAPLPKGILAKQVSNFLSSGRSVIFFPPKEVDDTEFQGASWGKWERAENDSSEVVGFWRNEDDLLKRTLNGRALPLDEVKIYQFCSLSYEGRLLAKMENGMPLLTRASTDGGGAYFCSTLPDGSHSSLARNGIVIFAMLHRALSSGASSIGAAKNFVAGSPLANRTRDLKPLSISDGSLLAEMRPYSSGVYGDENQMVAINRPSIEDNASSLSRDQVESLFAGLDFHLIDEQLGSTRSLASEIWKMFIIMMGIALLLECILCLPAKQEIVNVQGEVVAQ